MAPHTLSMSRVLRALERSARACAAAPLALPTAPGHTFQRGHRGVQATPAGAAQAVGLNWEDFTVTDNTCKPHPSRPGFNLFRPFEILEETLGKEIEKDLISFGRGFTVLESGAHPCGRSSAGVTLCKSTRGVARLRLCESML